MAHDLIHSELTGRIIKAYYTVYNALGAGFLEKVYKNSMLLELRYRGLHAVAEMPIHVSYRGVEVGVFFADIVVEDTVIVELKSATEIVQEHRSQLMNYLKATKYELGLLMNFGPIPHYERRIYLARNKIPLARFDKTDLRA